MRSTMSNSRRIGAAATLLALTLAFLVPLTWTHNASEATQEPPVNLVLNGGFEAYGNTLPDSWGRWAPAGTGSVTKVPGHTGDSAVRITTDTQASRLALVQDISVPAGGGTYSIDFSTSRTGISGTGKAGIRVDVVDGSRGSTFFGSNTSTSGWIHSSGLFVVPSDARRVRLHVFNDSVKGTMDVDDIVVSKSDATSALRAEITAAGDIGLTWSSLSSNATVSSYDIYRGAAGSPVTPERENLIRSVPASLQRVTDQEWEPATSYTYLVVGRDALGAEVAKTNEVAIRSASADDTATSYVSASATPEGVHIGWRAASDAALPLTAVAHTEPVTSSTVSAAHTIGTDLARFGGITTSDPAAYVGIVDARGSVIASASRTSAAHPRIGLNDEILGKIDRLIETPGTPQDAWKTIKTRVDTGQAAFGSSPDRYAREAAFVYQVTGDPQYASLAFDAFVTAAKSTPFTAQQELNTANPVSSLAVTYDWAYNGWNEAQRSFAVDYFERTAVFFEFASHPNIILPDKASNWVGVVRGAELAQHLAVRGDADYGLREARIGNLIDEVRQHLDAANTEGGWFQEGLDYLDYTNMIALPGILGTFDAGIDALEPSWSRPDTANLLLHTVSLRQPSSKLQWGVGGGAGAAAFPLYLERAKSGELGSLIELFERTQGHRATSKWYSPGYITQAFIDWPESLSEDEQYEADKVYPAILDDEAGSYSFRNRLFNEDDVLLQLNNRNHNHLGWSGYDALGVSLMSHDVTWAGQPGKSQSSAAQYSRVLVDNKPTQAVGHGQTLASTPYAGQGGGYVSLDSSGNFQVSHAAREVAVDMTDRGATETLIAFHDSFSDSITHDWSWQLAPEAGVTVESHTVGDTIEFTFRKGDSWLRGWLNNAEGATATHSDGSFRLTRSGTSATFDVVLAMGSGAEIPTARATGSTLSVLGTTFDLNDLSAYEPGRAIYQACQASAKSASARPAVACRTESGARN
ncbi:hypothetical protein [Arthrobacter sp. D2-10]